MDIFHLAPLHKMKGKNSKTFQHFLFFSEMRVISFLAHYHSLIRKSSL